MYYASVVDNSMVGYFLVFHELSPNPTKNTYDVVDDQSIVFPAQSASQKPFKTMVFPLRYNLKSKLPFKYLMMCFTAI
jgi:hypothetical protein